MSNIDAKQPVVLTDKDLRQVLVRYVLSRQTCFNYETMQSGPWVWSMLPAMKKMYADDEIAKIMKEAVDTSLDSDCLSRLIESVVSSSFVADAEITISESDKDKVASDLINALSQKLKKGLTLKTSSSLSGGFIVKASDGSGYFDLSDDEIAKLLYPYLSENLRKLL